ncbi:hypothetical protein AQ610_09140 [Burkholderia humptydooensis]|nr:hypothetical protein AQ610_09140 [Burkholderia humptydooensis]
MRRSAHERVRISRGGPRDLALRAVAADAADRGRVTRRSRRVTRASDTATRAAPAANVATSGFSARR